MRLISFTPTLCPRSLDPFYDATYYIKWVKTSWTYSIMNKFYVSKKSCPILYCILRNLDKTSWTYGILWSNHPFQLWFEHNIFLQSGRHIVREKVFDLKFRNITLMKQIMKISIQYDNSISIFFYLATLH